MNTDGSQLIQITNNAVPDILPKWSSDGNTIVFSSKDIHETEGIFLIDADGSNRRPLVQTVSNDFDHCWSPDCEYVAFQTSYGNNDDEVAIVQISTGNITRLTTSAGWDSTPAWK